jgi:UDP-N-acetyl-2-amino-2-deoxyglucuronate dehydrogenase
VGTVVASTAVFPGFAQRLEISGTSGTVVIEDGEIARCELGADDAEAGPPASPTPRNAALSAAAARPAGLDIASHAAQISDLLGAIDEGRAPSVTGEDGRAALELVCAVYQSARDARPVQLPAVPYRSARLPGSS